MQVKGEATVKADSMGQDKLFFIVSFSFKMLILCNQSYLLFFYDVHRTVQVKYCKLFTFSFL